MTSPEQGAAPAVGQVLTEKSAEVMRVTISNPSKRNALTWEMYDLLEQVRDVVNSDPDLRVVVFRGAGGQAFVAGTDIRQFSAFTGEEGVRYEHRVAKVLRSLQEIRVPVIGVVEGPAVGAGLAIAACCDIIIATPDSTFGAPVAMTLGNCLPPGVIARLQSRLGAGRTMAMLMTSSLLSASDAATAGFVHAVVERSDLDERIRALTDRIVSSAPATLAGFKEIDNRLSTASPNVDADDVLRRCYGSADFHEGVHAFLEHRKPQWKGL